MLLSAACVGAQEPAAGAVAPPQDTNAIREAAFAAERRGDHSAAADAFLKLAKLEPSDPEWIVRAGDDLGRAGRIEEALDLLAQARKQFPDALAIPTMLARSYALMADSLRMRSGRDVSVQFYYEDAVRTADEVLSIDPASIDALVVRASSLLELGRAEEATVAARTAVAKDPAKYSTQALLGRILFERFLSLRRTLDAGQAADPAAAKAELEAHKKEAEVAFRAAAALDPTRGYPIASLGDIAAWSGDTKTALGHYRDALAADPFAKVNHGWVRTAYTIAERESLYAEAVARYRALDRANPKGTATLTWYLGQIAFDRASEKDVDAKQRTEFFKSAAEQFESTIEALPDYVDTLWWIVQARYWQGDVPAATRAATAFSAKAPRRFADMIRDDEATLAILAGMAASEYEAGRLAASRDLNQVIAYARDTADDWNNYAFLCRETRAYAESLIGYERALEKEPQSPQLLNDAAVILHYHLANEKNLARAKEMYEQALVHAKTQLESGELKGDARQRVVIAQRDARNNLAALNRR
jgi:tetratricopeptide (TPR) repeat protein